MGRVEPRAERGAEEALEELFRLRYPGMVRLAFALTGEGGLAEELAQEAFVRTWRAWPRLRDPEAAAGYLRAAVVNLARSALRRRLLERRARALHPGHLQAPDLGLRLHLLGVLQTLPPRQRACVALRYLEDLTEAEVARVLRVSVGTVKSQTHRALRRLGAALGGEDHG